MTAQFFCVVLTLLCNMYTCCYVAFKHKLPRNVPQSVYSCLRLEALNTEAKSESPWEAFTFIICACQDLLEMLPGTEKWLNELLKPKLPWETWLLAERFTACSTACATQFVTTQSHLICKDFILEKIPTFRCDLWDQYRMQSHSFVLFWSLEQPRFARLLCNAYFAALGAKGSWNFPLRLRSYKEDMKLITWFLLKFTVQRHFAMKSTRNFWSWVVFYSGLKC